MKLVTEDTTLEEFINSRDWLLEDQPTGAVYQVRRADLHGGDYYMYVIQSGRKAVPTYVKYTSGQGVVIASKLRLLDIIKSKRFNIKD